jgi:hypothetical protein
MLRDLISTEVFTILIVVCLLLVASAKLLYPKRFNDFASIVINFKYLKMYSRDQKFLDGFEALLFTNLSIGLAIFSYQFYIKSNISVDTSEILLFKIGSAIALFVLIKVLLERLIGSVLSIDSIVNDYLFQKISYKNYIGLLLIPVNAFLIYSLKPDAFMFTIVLGVLLIINAIGSLSFFKRNQSVIKKNFFYFILYLCALEISPYVILYKLITNI